jgi:RNA polymerase sigma factor (sigma-70 family)
MGDLTDGQLLARFAVGHSDVAEAAFAILVERHGPMVLRVCRNRLGNDDDAEEAAQAVFLVLARKAESVRRAEALASWLFGVAGRVAAKARVRAARRRHAERQRAIPATQTAAPSEPPQSWPELYEELERLPEIYRRPIVLCHLEGHTYEQAARQMQCPVRTVQTRLARGRERLRQQLTRRGVTLSAAGLATALTPEAASADWAGRTVATALRVQAGGAPTDWAEAILASMLRTKILKGVSLILPLTIAAACIAGLAPIRPAGGAPRESVRPTETPFQRAYDPPLPPTARLRPFSLTVVDDATGSPVTGALVKVFDSIQAKSHEFRTDAQGRLRIEYPTVDGWGFPPIEVRQDGYVPLRDKTSSEIDPGMPESLVMRLRGGASIGGLVVDEAGVPVTGATVLVSASGYSEPRRPENRSGTEVVFEVPTETDPRGRWHFDGLPPDAVKVELQILHPNYSSGPPVSHSMSGRGVRRPRLADLRRGTDRQILKRGVMVVGQVLDPDGRPIAGATVTESSRGNVFLPFTRRSTSDVDGQFAMHFEPNERIELTAQSGRLAAATLPLVLDEKDRSVKIHLAPGRVVRGRVVDRLGHPLPAALVWTPGFGPSKALNQRFWTDADGRFLWQNAPRESVPLSIRKGGFLMVGERTPSDDRELLVALTPSLNVTLRVHDAATGSPVTGYAVETGTLDEAGEVTWNQNGRMTGIREPIHRLELDGTLPGYKVWLTCDGYEPYVSRDIKGSESKVQLDVRLRATKEVRRTR